MDTHNLIMQDQEYLLHTYAKKHLYFERALGSILWTKDNQDYIDFGSGIGVCSVGHCNPLLIQNLTEQLHKITHISNIFGNDLQIKLAKRIVELSGLDARVFFSNSGAEANECAIKIARKFGESQNRYEIITLDSSFHGRTIATLKATGQEKFHQHFGPFPDGFVVAKNFEHVFELIGDKTCAVMLELIQGEGGVCAFDKKQIQQLSSLLKQKGLLLIVDEVQSGVYRSGSFLASQSYGIKPDIITLAKGLGGGIPIGATITTLKDIFTSGDHGSTFGGNFLSMQAGLSVLDILEKEYDNKLIDSRIDIFQSKISELLKTFPHLFSQSTGMGLMLGLQVRNQEIFEKILENSLKERVVVLKSGKNVIRFLPPITIQKEEINEGFERFKKACEKI